MLAPVLTRLAAEGRPAASRGRGGGADGADGDGFISLFRMADGSPPFAAGPGGGGLGGGGGFDIMTFGSEEGEEEAHRGEWRSGAWDSGPAAAPRGGGGWPYSGDSGGDGGGCPGSDGGDSSYDSLAEGAATLGLADAGPVDYEEAPPVAAPWPAPLGPPPVLPAGRGGLQQRPPHPGPFPPSPLTVGSYVLPRSSASPHAHGSSPLGASPHGQGMSPLSSPKSPLSLAPLALHGSHAPVHSSPLGPSASQLHVGVGAGPQRAGTGQQPQGLQLHGTGAGAGLAARADSWVGAAGAPRRTGSLDPTAAAGSVGAAQAPGLGAAVVNVGGAGGSGAGALEVSRGTGDWR